MKVSRNYDYYEDEKLYSTGNDELDELLERAFCEGYYYAQKEYFNLGSGIKTLFKKNPTKLINKANQTRKYVPSNIRPLYDDALAEARKGNLKPINKLEGNYGYLRKTKGNANMFVR